MIHDDNNAFRQPIKEMNMYVCTTEESNVRKCERERSYRDQYNVKGLKVVEDTNALIEIG